MRHGAGAGRLSGAGDAFHTLILDGIPRLSPDNYDKARRFIVLIDTLYDQRVKLIASADAMPDQLYQRGENARMFERTASRLDEMQSRDWLELPHLAKAVQGKHLAQMVRGFTQNTDTEPCNTDCGLRV